MGPPTDLADEPTYRAEVQRVFSCIEDALDAAGLDVDAARHGQVLEIAFEDRSKVVVNAQTPLRELWLASRAGGRHFRHAAVEGGWVDTRTGERLDDQLSAAFSLHAGQPVQISTARDGSG